jgi:Fe-Mn family superoxide dismutase
MKKPNWIQTVLFSGAMMALVLLTSGAKDPKNDMNNAQAVQFEQPPLAYAYNALEPYIDAMTMEVHYSKHHAAYTKNFNAALAEANVKEKNIEAIFARISQYPAAVRNNGGGYYNHNLFWQIIAPGGSKSPQGELLEAINKKFGSVDAFKEEFSKKAMSVFGSGWAWLIVSDGELKITSTPNQDNPLMDVVAERGRPVILIDVWEHAYYLKYQNRRKEYVDAFWNVINWDQALKNYLGK